MKTHVDGTNNRAVCGMKLKDHTKLKEKQFATCIKCLERCYLDVEMVVSIRVALEHLYNNKTGAAMNRLEEALKWKTK